MKDTIYDSVAIRFTDIFQCDKIIGVTGDQISLLKNRYQPVKKTLSIEEIEDVSIDLICMGLQIHYRPIFSEALKQEIKTKIQEIINEYRV